MEAGREQYIVPVGPGGVIGRLWRFLVFCATGGFLYPNVFIEGLDCSKIQGAQQGTLYDKK
jgi:hypothetical protein